MNEFVKEIIKKDNSATFFHSYMWLDTVKYYWNLDYIYDIQKINNKNIIMPVSVFHNCNNNDYYFSTFKGYGGYLSDQLLEEHEENIVKNIYFNKYNMFKTRDNPLKPWKNILLKPSVVECSYIIEKSIGLKLSSHHSREVKKAKSNGITIREAKNQEWIEFYKKCYLSTAKHWNNPSIIYRYDILDYLKTFENHVKLYIAEYKNNIVSGVVIFKLNKHAHYWLCGNDMEFRKLSPNYLLIYETAKKLFQDNIEHIDLGVSGNNSNIIAFKNGFSATPFISNQYSTDKNFEIIKKSLSN